MALKSSTQQHLELLAQGYIRQRLGFTQVSSTIYETVYSYSDRKHITIGLVGTFRSGKSTLGGRMCYEFNHQHHSNTNMDMENHSQNGLYSPTPARNEKWSHYFDEDEEEQLRQMSVHGNMLQVFTMSYVVSLIDTPGYKRYIKNFIRYICQSGVIIVVFGADDLMEKPSFSNMPSTPNADKLAFSGYYQLLDKLRICHLFEIEQLIIVVNKLDKFNYSQRKFNECKSEIEKLLKYVGYGSMKDKFPIIPVSAINGDNILQKSSKNQKLSWWNDRKSGGYRVVRRQTFKRIGYALGYTVYDAIESINYNEIKMYNKDNILNLKPFKMSICNEYDEILDGSVVCGRVENGKISIGTMIKCVPSGSRGQIKSIEMFHKKCESAQYGDIVGISLDNFLLHPQKGDIMINESNTKEYEVTRFEAIIDVYPSTDKIAQKYKPGKYNESKNHFKGGFSPLIMTNNGIKCQCQLIRILWKLNKNANVKQQKLEDAPFVQAGDTGKVLFEPFRQFPISALQKIVILEHQQVVMSGKVTKLHYADEKRLILSSSTSASSRISQSSIAIEAGSHSNRNHMAVALYFIGFHSAFISMQQMR